MNLPMAAKMRLTVPQAAWSPSMIAMTAPAAGTIMATSFSTRMAMSAAGIAALVWSVNTVRSREQVLQCLTSTAQFANGPSGSKGYGNINAAAAVNCALSQ